MRFTLYLLSTLLLLRFICFERGQCQSCASKSQRLCNGKSLCADAVVLVSGRIFMPCSHVDVCAVLFLRAYFNAWMILNFLRLVFYKLMTKWAAHVNETKNMIAYLESYFVFDLVLPSHCCVPMLKSWTKQQKKYAEIFIFGLGDFCQPISTQHRLHIKSIDRLFNSIFTQFLFTHTHTHTHAYTHSHKRNAWAEPNDTSRSLSHFSYLLR